MASSRWFLSGRSWPKLVAAVGVVGLAISLSACGKEGEKGKEAAAPPPPTVVVTEVIQKTVPLMSEFVAQTDAMDTVEIRARIPAFLEQMNFTEGTLVKKDQLLFTLDKREYEAQRDQARAQLAKAEADLAFAKDNATVETAKASLDVAKAGLGNAETDERRLKPLAERKAVPQQDYDTAAAKLDAARANVAAQRAALETAQVNQKTGIQTAQAAVEAAKASIAMAELNLSYCVIRSPIDGLIGKREVSVGNLVGKGEATLLATVSQINPARVYLTISESQYLLYQTLKKEGKLKGDAGLELVLADGSVYPHKGRFTFAERAVDVKTGTLALVTEFPNPDHILRPGMFGSVRFAGQMADNAILIPRIAVQEVQGAKSVLVVGTDNMVELKTITPGETVGDLLIVRRGLTPGERVIVEGLQKARPGTKVNPTVAPVSQASATAETAKAAPSPVPKPAEAKAAGKAKGK